ncbi:helix-turn-helix transcriptional regulator [Cupriavidus metallidurans]|uniref:helix-turn-helix transcriptional regulator n=1 Tax=Cupriavidus metallidurans TaxID=119219 RepID=UPI0035C6BE56
MTDKLLTFAQVADRLGVGKTTLREMIRRGDFAKPLALSPGRIAFIETEVDDWVKQRARRQWPVVDTPYGPLALIPETQKVDARSFLNSKRGEKLRGPLIDAIALALMGNVKTSRLRELSAEIVDDILVKLETKRLEALVIKKSGTGARRIAKRRLS